MMSAPETSMRRVTAINNGTVIDHVPAGKRSKLIWKLQGIYHKAEGAMWRSGVAGDLSEDKSDI